MPEVRWLKGSWWRHIRSCPEPVCRRYQALASGVGLGLAMAVAAGLVALNRAGHAIKEVVLEEYNRRMG